MRHRYRLIAAAIALFGMLVGALAAAPHDGGRAGEVPLDEPTLGPLIAGTSALVDGTYVWTDYAYDDRGPDTDDTPGGDASYDAGPGNLADLIQLQLRPDGADWRIRAVLETLLDPGVPLLGVGIDTDADAATGAATIPGGAWTADAPLGLDRFVVASASGGQLLEPAADGWRMVADLPVSIDAGANIVEVALPQAALSAGQTVRLVGVLGTTSDPWRSGGGPVYDLAFVGDEPLEAWQDTVQARVLVGTAPAERAVATIHLGQLRRGDTHLPTTTAPGFHTLLYRSALDLGEGIRSVDAGGPDGVTVPISNLYAGPYQPYIVRVPDVPLPDRPPLLVYLHGITTTHIEITGQFRDGAGFDPPAIVAFPLGRGETSFYIGAGEQDVLDVRADAARRFGADPGRIALAGRSMGGFGTFRFGVRYPHLWSSLTAFIGTGASAQSELSLLPPELRELLVSSRTFPAGNGELTENLRNLPIRMVNGQLDYIVNPAFPERDALRLAELGYEHRYWSLTRREHEVEPALSNCLLTEAVAAIRDRDPARVTYAVEPAIFMEDPSTGLDLRYDGAYWVSGIEARSHVDDSGEKAVVDVTSLARPDREPGTRRLSEVGENLTAGRDLCGPNAEVRTGDAWRMRGIDRDPVGDAPTSNAAIMRLRDVAAVTLDVSRMSLRTDVPLELQVAGDGRTRLRLIGPWPAAVRVLVDGIERGTARPQEGVLELRLDLGGHHTIELVPGLG